MVEIYDYSKISLNLSGYIRTSFYITIILLTIFLISSLIIWLVGVKIKSEKTIKVGMRLSLGMLLLIFLMFGMVILIAKIL